MQEIGINIHVPLEEYQQRLDASMINQDHVALVISFGGRGSSIGAITELLKKNKTPIVLICSTLENPLKNSADYILYMSSHEDHYNKISSFSTRMSLLYILDSLYTCYFKLDYDRNIKNKLTYYEKMTQIK
ncbi:MAG: MurR/RpiR family transcriptional regulator [Coprobacillus cateniformis]